MIGTLANWSIILRRVVRHFLIEPVLRRRYARRTEAFTHRTPDGLIFNLLPGEFIDRSIAVEGIYEKRFLEYVLSFLPLDAVVLDIGANIGNHAIYLASRCKEIHCFEPNPSVADRLRWNIHANGLTDRITVHEYGLSDSDCTLTFHENLKGNLGGSRFVQSEDVPPGYRALKLNVRRADNAIAKLSLSRIDYIKIDVEGMEEAVLTALKSIIDQFRPIVSFEHHEHLAKPGTFRRIVEIFEGYHLVEPSRAPAGGRLSKALWNLRHKGGPVLVEVVTPEQRTYENIVAFPNDARII